MGYLANTATEKCSVQATVGYLDGIAVDYVHTGIDTALDELGGSFKSRPFQLGKSLAPLLVGFLDRGEPETRLALTYDAYVFPATTTIIDYREGRNA